MWKSATVAVPAVRPRGSMCRPASVAGDGAPRVRPHCTFSLGQSPRGRFAHRPSSLGITRRSHGLLSVLEVDTIILSMEAHALWLKETRSRGGTRPRGFHVGPDVLRPACQRA